MENRQNSTINWFPGRMAKTKKQNENLVNIRTCEN